MSFFRRKEKPQIPPVERPSRQGAPSLGSSVASSTTYVASGGGDLSGNNSYNQQASPGGYGGSYDKGYNSSTGGAPDPNRSELFAGYNPEHAGPNIFTTNQSAPGLREPVPGEGDEDDVENIKQQIRYTKQESVSSSRNALRLAREAEETARGTLLKLGEQSEKLASTERHLDISKNHALRAEDNTDELKKLNRSIFVPVITFNKDAKRAAKEAKIQARYDEDRDERERNLMDVRETHNNLESAASYGQDRGRRELTVTERAMREEERSRYQFEADEVDNQLEGELDDNLGEIGDAAKKLRALGLAMGRELDTQNSRIDRIGEKATNLDRRMFTNTHRLNKIK